MKKTQPSDYPPCCQGTFLLYLNGILGRPDAVLMRDVKSGIVFRNNEYRRLTGFRLNLDTWQNELSRMAPDEARKIEDAHSRVLKLTPAGGYHSPDAHAKVSRTVRILKAPGEIVAIRVLCIAEIQRRCHSAIVLQYAVLATADMEQ